MKIIVEAGGSKCRWALIGSHTQTFTSIGFNPNTSQSSVLADAAYNINKTCVEAVEQIIFFGAGCGNNTNKQLVKEILYQAFECQDISVHTDLEAAAIAHFGNNCGIAAILGTGAAAGCFNGKTITHQAPSLGFLMGDEGSGAYLGKMLVTKIIREELNSHLCSLFWEIHNTSASELIRSIYANKSANQQLANFVPFIAQHSDYEDIKKLTTDAFNLFYEKHILPIKGDNERVGLVGGIAHQFSKQIATIFYQKGIEVAIKQESFNDLLTHFSSDY